MDYKVSIEFTGDVFKPFIEIDNNEIGLLSDGSSSWKREIAKFPMKDTIKIKLHCKGFNGAEWELKISLDSKSFKEYKGVVGSEFPGESILSEILTLPKVTVQP